jgi:hypothetical protein
MPELNLAELRKIVYKTISDEVPSSEFNGKTIGKIQLVEFGPSGAVQPFIVDIRADFQLEHADGTATYSLSLETNERGQYLLKFINVQKTFAADPGLKFNVTNGKIYLGASNSAFKFISIEATKEVKAGYLLNPVMLVLEERPLPGWTDIVYNPADPEAMVFESIRARDKMTVEGDLRVEGNFVITESLVFDSTATYESIIINNLGNGNPLVVNKVDVNGTPLINDLFKLDALGNISILGNINLKESLVFEGLTANNIKTTLAVIDPTANQTYQLPNKAANTYTLATTSDIYNSTITFNPGNGIFIDINTNNNKFNLNQDSNKTISIAHSATSTLNGQQGSSGISSVTLDQFGHVTAVGTSTYLTSQSTDFKTVTVDNTPEGFTWTQPNGLPISIVADTVGDELILVSGTGINMKLDATNDAVKIDISTVPVANGGTGITEYLVGDILYADNESGSIVLKKLSSAGKEGSLLAVGENNIPTWLSIESGLGLLTLEGTETLKNKSLEDSSVSFFDNTTNSKKMQFELSGISENTTRLLTIPNSDGKIVLTNTGLSTSVGNVPTWNDTSGNSLSSGYTVQTTLSSSTTALVRADAITTALDVKSDKTLSIETIPDGSTYSVATTDASKVKVYNGTTNLTITISNSSSYPVGAEIAFIKRNTGTVTFGNVSGQYTILADKLKIKSKGSAVLLKIDNTAGANVWSLVGNLEA